MPEATDLTDQESQPVGDGSSIARLHVVSRGLAWGLGIGAGLGALAGTLIAPVIGTIVGALVGLATTSLPTVLGTAALYVAARPGTSHEAFRRRVRIILAAIGVLVVVGGMVGVIVRVDPSDPAVGYLVGPVVLTVLLVPYLLLRANGSIAAVEPAPAGTRDRSGLGLLLLVSLIVGVLGGRMVWNRVLSPEARALRAVEAERDSIARRIGITAIGSDHYVHRTETGQCTGDGGQGFISDGYGDLGPNGSADAAARAAQLLGELGYRVSKGQSYPFVGEDPEPWVFGLKPDQSATVEIRRDSVFVAVTHGCRNRQPKTEDPLGPPRLLAAAVVEVEKLPTSMIEPLGCDEDASSLIAVTIRGHLDADGAMGGETWRMTTASGEAVETSCAEPISDGQIGVGRVPGSPEDPPVRIELIDPDDSELLASLPIDERAVDIAPPGDGARLVHAEPVGSPVVGADRGDGCPDDVVTGVRVVWDRPVDIYESGGRGYGPTRAGAYRVTIVALDDRIEVSPTAIGDINDTDNSHLLCIAAVGIPVKVDVDASEVIDLQGSTPTQPGGVAVERP